MSSNFLEILIFLFLLINIGFLNLIFNYNNFILLLISFEMLLFITGLLFFLLFFLLILVALRVIFIL